MFNFHNAQIFLIGGKLAKANVFSKAKNCKSISIHYVKYPSLCSWFNSIKLPRIACLPLHQIRAIFKLIVPKFHRFFFYRSRYLGPGPFILEKKKQYLGWHWVKYHRASSSFTRHLFLAYFTFSQSLFLCLLQK